jgi:5-methylcytosine-specific restriction enzyme subunit McrC
VAVGPGDYTHSQADALLGAARAHPLANRTGTNVLVDGGRQLHARQMVGLIAAPGCSLEILPKIDGAEGEAGVRRRLVRMLDVALGLDLDLGTAASMARQDETLLDVLIRHFADGLLAQVRRGLPRRYLQCEDDLPALRGRLDVARQFTRNIVRPDRLACRFDQLDPDTPLMRIMAAAVVACTKHARGAETQRRLVELRHALTDIPLLPTARLPWRDVRIDRSNRRWASLFALAKLLLGRHWQDTGHDAAKPDGLTLLFPMNDLFEAYIAALLRRAMAGSGVEVSAQGGGLHCLGAHTGALLERGTHFATRPDILLRKDGRVVAIIDTKWKRLAADPLGKGGVAQGDVYQMMAYARLYRCPELMLLYPAVEGAGEGVRRAFGMAGGKERLSIATVDVGQGEAEVVAGLRALGRRLASGQQVLVDNDLAAA